MIPGREEAREAVGASMWAMRRANAPSRTSSGEGTEGEPVAVESFELFFEVEHERLFGALYLVTGDRHDAEELMQEAFLRVWERWDRVRGFERPTGYLYRTAMNAFRMRYRHALVAARRRIVGDPPGDPFEDVDMRDDLRRALSALPPRRRAALVLTELLDFTPGEAARILGVRASTIRGAAAKARAALREQFDVGAEDRDG